MSIITQEDIEQMWANGHDYQSILEAENKLKRTKMLESLLAQIKSAFSDTILGDGIGLWEAKGLDDYEDSKTCATYRMKDEWLDWTAISLETLQRCNSSPSFFDADGFRFHLPAFMCADLTEDYGFDFIYSLTCFKILGYSRYTSLSPEQRLAVRSYLLFQLDDLDNDYERDNIQKALDNYWSKEITTYNQ